MNPLTDEVKEGFAKALHFFDDWVRHGNSEPSIQLKPGGTFFTIGEVARLVTSFENEPLLDPTLELLQHLLNSPQRPWLIEKLGQDKTYHAGAFCFSVMIEERNSRQRK